ncbi:hypothetical protein AAEX37_00893 [Oligella sp. MSHR50489EDL]|uniref:hypothetical protein n=1 Tax=Oligella sp. MSHR50489EDL TaxID=3139409 RepID=UPI003D814061
MKKVFTDEELEILAKTADALSAWTGKCVLCEKNITEDGLEVAIFAQVLDTNAGDKQAGDADEAEEPHAVRDEDEGQFLLLGGADSAIIGSAGGLEDISTQMYECRLLFSIMFNAEEGQFAERFILVNDEFELVTTADDIEELVPFSLREVDEIDDWIDEEDWDSEHDHDDDHDYDDDDQDDEDEDGDWVEHHRLDPLNKERNH